MATVWAAGAMGVNWKEPWAGLEVARPRTWLYENNWRLVGGLVWRERLGRRGKRMKSGETGSVEKRWNGRDVREDSIAFFYVGDAFANLEDFASDICSKYIRVALEESSIVLQSKACISDHPVQVREIAVLIKGIPGLSSLLG